MTPWVLFDSSSRAISYSSSWRLTVKDNQTMMGSYATCDPVSEGAASWSKAKLSLSVDGTHIDMYGQVPDGTKLLYTLVGLDSDEPVPPLKINGQKSELIGSFDIRTSGSQTFRLLVQSGNPIIDYFLVKPRPESSFYGKRLIVDDRDSYITYTGNWTEGAAAEGLASGSLLQNTRKGSKNAGDSASILFDGSDIGVYGILSPAKGRLVANYTIDGGVPTQVVHFDGGQAGDPNLWSINQELFYQDLDSGRHNLTISVVEATDSQALWLDYVTFEGISGTTLAAPSSSSSGNSSSKFPAYAWGIIAAFVLLCLCGGGGYAKKRRRLRVVAVVEEPAPAVWHETTYTSTTYVRH